jgi:hypothetical protein
MSCERAGYFLGTDLRVVYFLKRSSNDNAAAMAWAASKRLMSTSSEVCLVCDPRLEPETWLNGVSRHSQPDVISNEAASTIIEKWVLNETGGNDYE